MRFGLPRIVARAQAKIFVQPIRIDQLARIHLPIGIPERLELAESLHELGSKHLRQEFTARLPISVLARDRAAITDHQIGSLLHEKAEFADAFRRFEIVIHTCMDAGVPEVSIERTIEFVRLHQLAQVAQISAKFVGPNGRIFKALPTQRLARNMRRHSEARLANVPDSASLARVCEHAHLRRSRGALQRLHQVARLRFGFGDSRRSEFAPINHPQPSGNKAMASRLMPLWRLAFTTMSSKPSSPMGRCSMICGT